MTIEEVKELIKVAKVYAPYLPIDVNNDKLFDIWGVELAKIDFKLACYAIREMTQNNKYGDAEKRKEFFQFPLQTIKSKCKAIIFNREIEEQAIKRLESDLKKLEVEDEKKKLAVRT